MNTVSMGFQLLKKELNETGYNNREVNEILDDTKASADVAVDLVSDLLLYDKLEEGALSFEKFAIKFWKLLEKTVKPFVVQVNLITSFFSI